MSITEQIHQFYLRNLPGMNNKGEELEHGTDWVKVAQNCRFEGEPGTVEKRNPITYFNSASIGTGAITGVYRYYTSSGVTKFVSVHGTTAYVGSDTSGTWTSIRSSLTTGKRMSFVTYRDLLICSNGYDAPFVYDGSADNLTWELGSCKAVLAAGGSNLDSAATYTYKVTIDADAYVCDAVSNTVTTDAANRKVTLSNLPLGPTGATNRKIYRTEGGGATWKLLATIADNTTTTYDDDVADATLTDAYPSVTDAIPKGNILKIHRERFFISGDPTYPNRIYYSNVYLPHYIQQTTNSDFMNISADDNDEIMGIPIQLGVMLCIKKNTIRKLHITSAVSGADPATWYADDPISFVGSPAQWSVTQTPYGVIFLGWDHWYMFNGANVKTIIDEFDTKEMLDSAYHDTVGYWHDGIFLAGYTSLEAAEQQHDRVMRYNFKRNKVSYDTISANCFTSKIGDDETGELYYGDSSNGYVYKDENEETLYRLNSKTMCEAGTKTNIFIGGTESSPYIELGSITSASEIPDNVCMFWDQEEVTPGEGWTEIDGDDRMIIINTTASGEGGSSLHTHSIDGELEQSTASLQEGGDSENNCTSTNHTHDVDAFLSDANEEFYPRSIKWRCFKKNSTSTEYEFPEGAILMWDQNTAPTGWQTVGQDGYYVRMGDEDLNSPVESFHKHGFSTTSKAGGDYLDSGLLTEVEKHAPKDHTHDVEGTAENADMSDWELDHVAFNFIKKIGESDTWDSSEKYIYALFDAAGTPSGWEDMTATYNDRYLKMGKTTPTTGEAENSAHTHTIYDGQSEYHNGLGPGYGGYVHQMIELHKHYYTFEAAETEAPGVRYRTFRLMRKLLGKMKDYNSAIESATITGGEWLAPSIEINAETLNKLYWNETLVGTDNVLMRTRTGATKVACESSAWDSALTDPNGSVVPSTANIWFQYQISFYATDTTISNPKVYLTNGYVVKVSYTRGSTVAETAVEFIYQLGLRNFESPSAPKRFKKLQTIHDGSVGNLDITWETEEATATFEVDLSLDHKRWNSFFHDTACGTELDVKFYKNDLYAFKLKEVKGLYSSLPVIV